MLRISKKSLIISTIILFILFVGVSYDLPYYIYKPGMVSALDDVVDIEERQENEGHLYLVTVSGSRATPIQLLTAKLSSYHEVVPLEVARPEGISDEDYNELQLKMMENSQNTSKYVAYEAAGKNPEIEFNGVYVMHVVEEMPAEGIVQIGDRIKSVDSKEIKEAKDLTTYVEKKQAGEEIELTIVRDKQEMTEVIEVTSFPDDEEKVGIGIQLVTDEKVNVSPEISFSSGKIGGPSAGFIFALEIYNQLTTEDWTKGYEIVGTGEIDYDGTIHRIGGIDKKVIAAHKAGIDIFFAPNEEGNIDSNYNEAQKVAVDIDTPMEIVPVDSFDDALDYLESIEPIR